MDVCRSMRKQVREIITRKNKRTMSRTWGSWKHPATMYYQWPARLWWLFPRSPSVHWQLFRVGLGPNAHMFFLSLFPMFFSLLRRATSSAHWFFNTRVLSFSICLSFSVLHRALYMVLGIPGRMDFLISCIYSHFRLSWLNWNNVYTLEIRTSSKKSGK